MKIGQKVWICHDGKWSRRKEGIVTGTKNGYRIKVKFLEGDDKNIEFWVRKHPAIRYGYERHHGKHFSIHYGKRYARYSGGIDDYGTPRWCPWHSILKRKDNLDKDGRYNTIPTKRSVLKDIILKKMGRER